MIATIGCTNEWANQLANAISAAFVTLNFLCQNLEMRDYMMT